MPERSEGEGLRREEWVRFTGEIIERTPFVAVLTAADRTVSFSVDLVDFAHGFDHVTGREFKFIRVGTKFRDVTISEGFRRYAIGPKTEKCPNGTRCYNNLQTCCGSDELVGSCNGQWRCEND